MRRALAAFGVILTFAVLAAFLYVPGAVDRRLNRVVGAKVPEPSSRARALFASLRVVDLHADSLLWARDLSKRLPQGHVDLPRLVEGNVTLQVFGVVTQAPLGQNFERNDVDAPDLVTALAVLERWSPRAWFSRRARVHQQARVLEKLSEHSDGRLVVVRTADDLKSFLEERATNPEMVAGLLGVEGAQAIEGRLENVDALFADGVRMIGLAHFTDNAVAGSSAGADKQGLTDLGREVVKRMESLGMAVDLAHVSPAAIDDVLAMATEPVVVSHGGLQSVCAGPRNLSDAHVRAIAKTGGVIGIGFFAGTVCGTSPADVARSIRAARDLAGIEHVALGSDFDGAVTTAFDATGLASIVDALQAEGMPDDEIRLVMGENALRVLGKLLPANTPGT
jgi:membrane dipeptidase